MAHSWDTPGFTASIKTKDDDADYHAIICNHSDNSRHPLKPHIYDDADIFNLREGFKKNLGKSMVFYQTPPPAPPPPPRYGLFPEKKFTPIFCLLKNASLMAETNFTLGPISKTIKFPF